MTTVKISQKLFLLLMLMALTLDSHAQIDLTATVNPEVIQRALEKSRQSKVVSTNAQQYISQANKIGLFLKPLVDSQTLTSVSPPKSTPFRHIKNGTMVQVYIELNGQDDQTIEDLKELGAEIEIYNTELNKVQAWIKYAQLDTFAAHPSVSEITVPSYSTPAAGRVTTEGDAILRANLLRDLGATGRGVKVGVVSDGANDWPSAAGTGDLPSNVTTYGICSRRSADPQNCRSALTCNEGTAMAEIIHDIAPEAELAVAAVSTSLEFIQQINRLAGTFGADIIVDDLGFFGEPYFEDGDLARAVSALPSNILYFSSAGNSGNTHYEREYSTLSSTSHNFGVQAGTNDETIGFTIRPNRGAFVLLQWNDRYANPNSDYDLFIFDQNNEVGRSNGRTSTAIEGVCVYNGSGADITRFAVVDKASGVNRRLEMFFLGARNIEYSIPNGSVFGHAGTSRAIAVGAINVGSNSPAFYSSRGPSVIDYPSIQSRAKPDISATDGVSVTGAGGFSSPFFGTSAAAPHAAAIAALLLSSNEELSPQQVRTALLNTATGGNSSALGRGRIDALLAYESFGFVIDVIPPLLPEKVILPPLSLLLDDED
jgi:hypothetical protein